MNTTFFLTVSVEESGVSRAEAKLHICHEMLNSLEATLSEFREYSDVFRLKKSKVNEKIKISSHTLFLLEEANRISKWSKNAFNPSFRSKNELSLAENFAWDRDDETAWKLNSDAQLGWGAIGKGYALDVLHRELIQAGFQNHRLNAGGSSLIFSGEENIRIPWKLSLAVRKNGMRYEGIDYECSHSPLFVGISGNLEQGEHIERPISSMESVVPTVVGVTASSCARADAFSTAIFAAPNLVEKYVDGAFILIDNEETVFSSPTFEKHFRGLP